MAAAPPCEGVLFFNSLFIFYTCLCLFGCLYRVDMQVWMGRRYFRLFFPAPNTVIPSLLPNFSTPLSPSPFESSFPKLNQANEIRFPCLLEGEPIYARGLYVRHEGQKKQCIGMLIIFFSYSFASVVYNRCKSLFFASRLHCPANLENLCLSGRLGFLATTNQKKNYETPYY